MTELPETRESLLLRIRDSADAAAWDRFVATYRPAVYRLARRRGLQDADAEDLAQQVMSAVARAIATWRKDGQRGTFRGWLLQVARNACVNLLTRGRTVPAVGGTSALDRIEQVPATEQPIDELINDEHQRAVFRWAADEARPDFQDATWQAFWLTAIDGASVDEAALALGKSVGTVYAARSRVMRRLKELVREFESQSNATLAQGE